jgi:hypothetical protein
MTPPRRPATLVALALVVGALGVAGGAAAPPAPAGTHAAAANSVTFQDSVGEEDPRAPDVTTVVVSNDDAGLLSFEIHFANRVALGPGEELTLWLDTKELGAQAAFDFFIWVDATPEDEDVSDVDTAPDTFWVGWTYELKLPPPPPALELSAIVCTPKPVRSGKPMTAKAKVSISRASVPEALGSAAAVTWTATVGSARLKTRSTAVFTDGVLSATWLLPKSTKGKLARLSVSVTQEGITTAKRRACRAK